MYTYRISLKKGQVVKENQPCHWMLEVDERGLEQLLNVFEGEAPQKEKGIISAYRELTVPESQVGMVQFPNHSDREWYKFAAKEFVNNGTADLFATAVVEGRLRNYPDIQLTIWHPRYPTVFLEHKGCDNTKTRECKGSIHLLDDEEPTFGIQRESWVGRINSFESILTKAVNEDEKYSAKNALLDYTQEESLHKRHEEELIGAITELSRYLPELKEGEVCRKFAYSEREAYEKLPI